MPSAITYFLIAAAFFGTGLLFTGLGMMLFAKTEEGRPVSALNKALFCTGGFIMLLSVGIFSMALYILLKARLGW